MKTIFITAFLMLNFAAFTQTEPVIISWERSLGGEEYDYATSIQQTSDSGFIVAGFSNSKGGNVSGNHGHGDYWIVKLNQKGEIQWQRSLGGYDDDFAKSIQQTSDGGYIVAGYSSSNDGDVSGNHGYPDYWIVKLNKKGKIQWQKSLGGSYYDHANSIQQTFDNGYIVAGASRSKNGDVGGNHGSDNSSDYWIVKLNQKGKIQWQKWLGGSYSDEANSIQQTSDGGYIVAGYSSSNDGDVSGNHGNGDYWIVKLNKSGKIQWQKSLGGSSGDGANSIQQTSDGGYIVAGSSWSNDGDVSGNHGNGDCWIVKLNKKGIIQWQKSLGGSGDDIATSIQQTFNGLYIVAGSSNSNDDDVSGNHGADDYWVVRLTKQGNIQWQKSLGGSSGDGASSIQQTYDSGYIIAGTSSSEDGDVRRHHKHADYWIVKLKGADTTATFASSYQIAEIPIKNTLKESVKDFTAYPNPAKDMLHIQITGSATFSLIGPSGKILITKNITGQGSINIGTLPPGMYYLKNNTTGRLQKVMIGR